VESHIGMHPRDTTITQSVPWRNSPLRSEHLRRCDTTGVCKSFVACALLSKAWRWIIVPEARFAAGPAVLASLRCPDRFGVAVRRSGNGDRYTAPGFPYFTCAISCRDYYRANPRQTSPATGSKDPASDWRLGEDDRSVRGLL